MFTKLQKRFKIAHTHTIYKSQVLKPTVFVLEFEHKTQSFPFQPLSYAFPCFFFLSSMWHLVSMHQPTWIELRLWFAPNCIWSACFCFVFAWCSHFRRKTMARSLRSNSRWQKLHVQQIQQVNRRLRVRLNNHTETKIDYFEQKEFLSLFGLHPINHSHVSDGRTKRNTVYTEKNGSRRRITRPNDDDSNDEFEIRSQLSKTLGEINNVFMELSLRCWSYISFVSLILICRRW